MFKFNWTQQIIIDFKTEWWGAVLGKSFELRQTKAWLFILLGFYFQLQTFAYFDKIWKWLWYLQVKYKYNFPKCSFMIITLYFAIVLCLSICKFYFLFSFWKKIKWRVNLWLKNMCLERKKELLPFATAWMELESIMLSEISQAVRDKYHMISPLTGT